MVQSQEPVASELCQHEFDAVLENDERRENGVTSMILSIIMLMSFTLCSLPNTLLKLAKALSLIVLMVMTALSK